MENFTPISALAGGTMLGLATALLLWSNGRVAGISGIFSGLFVHGRSDWAWRAVFLIGLVIGGLIHQSMLPPEVTLDIDVVKPDVALLVVSGLLVGVGVTLGAGCTSGHGICGLSRFSPRSIVATILFMITAMLTVFIVAL